MERAEILRIFRERSLIISTSLFFLLMISPSFFISSDGVAKGLYAFLILLALLNNARAVYCLLLPFFLLTPFAIYYAVYYRMPTDISLWFTLFGTSITESRDYLQHARVGIFAMMALPFVLGAILCFPGMKGQYFSKGSKWRIAAVALLLIPLSYIPRNADARDYALDMYRHFRKAYPENVMLGYMAASMEVAKLRDMVKAPPQLHPEIESDARHLSSTYVMVIGESARRDRWHAYGYKVPDTPVMESLPDVMIFRDMVTYGYVTTDSVPYILSKSSNGHMNPSFLTAFRQAGYKVSWLSNQARYGEFDSLISAYASEADNIKFLNSHSYSMNYQDSFDELLMPSFKEALADPAPRKLIVLHLYGSHPDFDKRYPPVMGKFVQPYDNSIYYTDYLLGRIIGMTGQARGPSALLYISDHGLNLGDCPNVTGHIDFTPSYQVPFLVWTSPDWQKAFPGKQLALIANKEKPVHSGDIFDTLTDMAGIRFPSQNLKQSMADSGYLPHVRLVKAASGELDFDHSKTGPDCHLKPVQSQ